MPTGSTKNQGQYQAPQRAYEDSSTVTPALATPHRKYVPTLIATSRKPNVTGAVRLKLLGEYSLALGTETIESPTRQKARSLLAYLVLRRGETLRRSTR
jgi:hypothetical protein